MKKMFNISRLILFAFITIFTASTVKADDSTFIKNTIPAEVRYCGIVNNNPVFEIRIGDDSLQDDFTIIISDYHTNILFRENIRAASYSKKFLLKNDEIGDEPLYVEIFSRKTKKSVVFEIKNYNKIVQEFEMNRIK